MNFKQYLLFSLTIIFSLNFGRGEELIQPAYYYILTQPIPVDYNKANPLSQTGEICFVDANQQQQQLYQQLIPNPQPKEAINPELFITENSKNIQENQIPNQAMEIQNSNSQIYSQSGEDSTKIINGLFTDSNQTESSTDSGGIFVSTNPPVKNNSKVVDLHKVIIRNANENEGSPKSKKAFDIVFSHEVLQQMSRDLVNTFLNKIPGGVKNLNFTQFVEDVEKVIKTHLPYGILSVANGEVSNFVQNVLPRLNGQQLQNLMNNQNMVNNYPNGFDSRESFFNYVYRNGGPGLQQPENARNYNSLFMGKNGQPENRNFQNPYPNNNNNYYGQPENRNFNSQFTNNNNFNSVPTNLNNGQFNLPPGQNFNSVPSMNSGRNFNFPLLNNNNNGQPENRNSNPQFANNGQPGFRNFDSPIPTNNNNNNNNVQSRGQNANFPFNNNNNVQRRMVKNPNSYIFKLSDRNSKNSFT